MIWVWIYLGITVFWFLFWGACSFAMTDDSKEKTEQGKKAEKAATALMFAAPAWPFFVVKIFLVSFFQLLTGKFGDK